MDVLYPRLRVQQTPAITKVRLRVTPSIVLRLEMQATDTEIQWRVGAGDWQDLIALSAFLPERVTQYVTANSDTVNDGTAILVLNKPTPGNTDLYLPPVANRGGGLDLTIVDWTANAADLTIHPNGSESIAKSGQSSLVLTTPDPSIALSPIRLVPDTTLGGWMLA